MKIITKAEADKLYNANSTHRIKFCSGKYKPENIYVGRDVTAEVNERILAVYPIKGKDRDGPFIRLMCLCKN